MLTNVLVVRTSTTFAAPLTQGLLLRRNLRSPDVSVIGRPCRMTGSADSGQLGLVVGLLLFFCRSRTMGIFTGKGSRLCAVLTAVTVLAACFGSDDDPINSCGGIVNPSRVLTATPTTLTLDIGVPGSITTLLAGGCPGDSQTVTWVSSDAAIATVTSSGAVTAVAPGTSTLTATAFDLQTKATVTVTVRPRIATTFRLLPAVDTLSPRGTRALTVTVTDQTGAAIQNPTVSYRSLTPSLASVSASGVVTAVANGVARIEGSVARTSAADSLRDTVTVSIVAPCTLVRAIAVGSSYSGRFDASTCTNFLNFPQVDQFSVTSSVQEYYEVRLTPTFTASVVPLSIGSGFFGVPPTSAPSFAYVVKRPGTFGLLVAAPAVTTGTYTLTTTRNPDPRASCAVTDVTLGVTFQTAIVTQVCPARLIRLLPQLQFSQVVRITARAVSFPARIELREFGSDVILATADAPTTGGTATINFTNPAARFAYVRLSGSPSSNDLVTITIDP